MTLSSFTTAIARGDRSQSTRLRARISRALNHRSLMSVFATLLLVSPGVAYAQSASGWRMHPGEGPLPLPAKVDREGAWQKAFDLAVIPSKDDAGWTSAPDPKTINFGSNTASKLGKDRCDLDVDYTYFETMVTIPAGTVIEDFNIHFKGMDDASRITVFPPGDTVGQIVADSYVRRGADVRTSNLKELVREGENRVVITQLDWCPGGNLLESATVELNGAAIESIDDGTEVTTVNDVAEVDTDDRPFLPASHGDVHVYTPDGLKFDFQATGDFILLQSTDGELVIQARQEAWEQDPRVSVNRAAALNVAGVRVEYYALPPTKLFIDGVETPIGTETITLRNGGRIVPDAGFNWGQRYLVYWPNGFTGRLTHRINNTMDIEVRNEISQHYVLAGLIGNLDGNSANDFTTRDGELMPFSREASNVNKFGESWRVPASESLFLKAKRPSSETPVGDSPLTLAALDPAAREASRAKCAAAGVQDLGALSNCTYDVTVTGDETFIESAKGVEQAVASIPQEQRVSDETLEDMKPVEAAPSRALKNGGVVQRTVTPAAPSVPKPDVAAAAPEAPTVDIPPPSDLPRGKRMTQNGHYLVFQEDGNLCVYREADDGWVWCINNDPKIDYARTATVRTTQAGQLVGQDADGVVLYALPAETPFTPVGVRITEQGVLEVYSADAVLWKSRD